jgi:flavorubredoxin
METRIDEIAEGIYRFSTWVPDVAQPDGFTFNQFLVDAEEPLLFHTGLRALYPLVSEAVAKVTPVDRLRWITFGHVEGDECGSMNQWLAAAPSAEVAHGAVGVAVQLNDLCDRPPRALQEGEVLDLGGKRLRQISTPHLPHGWEAQVLHEEVTGTLLCGDLFTQVGGGPALTTEDPVGAALAVDAMFGATSLSPTTGPALRGLAELAPTTLAVMHGPSFQGDGARALRGLADGYEAAAAAALAAAR